MTENKSITLAEGSELLLVSVPEDAYGFDMRNGEESHAHFKPFDYKEKFRLGYYMESVSFRQGQWINGDANKMKLLGTYTAPDKIDFEVKEEWVKVVVDVKAERDGVLLTPEIKLYQNYKYDLPQPVDSTFTTKEQSFLSLLHSQNLTGRWVLIIKNK